jgi:choline kinase
VKVVIMAQGQQTRLEGTIECPKQWVHLPYSPDLGSAFTAQEPILARTLRMLETLNVSKATVVATDALHDILRQSMELRQREGGRSLPSAVITLADPGNNLLAGMRAVFLDYGDTYQAPCVVLLGDVVYSWQTLRVLLRKERPANQRDQYWCPVVFAGTPVVTASAGELWGCSWDSDGLDAVLDALRRIKDPPFPDYQCGQLRKLLWEIQKREVLPPEYVPDPFRACATGRWYHPTTDYTADVDTPADLRKLPAIGVAAYADDQRERLARSAS